MPSHLSDAQNVSREELHIYLGLEEPVPLEDLGRLMTALARDYGRVSGGQRLVTTRIQLGSIEIWTAVLVKIAEEGTKLVTFARSLAELKSKVLNGGHVPRRSTKGVPLESLERLAAVLENAPNGGRLDVVTEHRRQHVGLVINPNEPREIIRRITESRDQGAVKAIEDARPRLLLGRARTSNVVWWEMPHDAQQGTAIVEGLSDKPLRVAFANSRLQDLMIQPHANTLTFECVVQSQTVEDELVGVLIVDIRGVQPRL